MSNPSLYQKIVNKLGRNTIASYWEQRFSNVPKTLVEEIHVANTKVIPSREDLLDLLPKNGIVAELGVDQGGFSQKILERNNPKKLHLIDVWETKRYNKDKQNSVEGKFQQQIQSGKVEINLGYSTEVVSSFEDEYFDWVYIDTDHSYATTKAELEGYQSKVKKDGVLAGHDFIRGSWEGLVRYGVIEAVYEFCKTYNWEIIYLTSELHTSPSFALRRIAK